MNIGQRRSPWLRIPLAVAAVAALAASLIAYGTLASRPGRAEATTIQGPVPQLPLESWYFPAQYVNQATQIEEQPEAF